MGPKALRSQNSVISQSDASNNFLRLQTQDNSF